MWFDSHCHLNLAGFDGTAAEVWAEARHGGVDRVFVPGTEPSESEHSRVRDLAGVSVGVGLHPFTLEAWRELDPRPRVDDALAVLAREAGGRRYVAIGECGWDKPLARRCPQLSLELQTMIVERHLQLAVELSLPIVLHVVQAHGMALETLRRYRLPRGGIVHCFSGNAELVSSYCRLGLSLGYGMQLTKPRCEKALAALRVTPRERIVLETDGPQRALHGGLPNSPLAVVEAAKVVSRVIDLPMAAVAELTFGNAVRVFDDRAASPTWA